MYIYVCIYIYINTYIYICVYVYIWNDRRKLASLADATLGHAL